MQENRVIIDSINTNYLNPYKANAEELIAEAMDQFGLIDEETKINETDPKEILKALSEKKKSFHGLNRKTTFITKLGSLLVQRNLISNMQLKEALNYQKHTPIKIGEILVQLGFINENDISSIIEEQKQIRNILEKLNKTEAVEVFIDYREPLFEKQIQRQSNEPYSYAQTVETSDVSQAVIDALTTFFSNERLSNVHWKSEIVGIRVSIKL